MCEEMVAGKGYSFRYSPNFFRMIEVEGPSLYFLSKRRRDAEETRACIADLGHHGQENF